jgi:radical SAM superfamily enzyme YgiQ (UPF0313 family)
MYSDIPYRRLDMDEIRQIVDAERGRPARRIFLADGDVMRRPFDQLREILELLNDAFPDVARINTYAAGSGILDKSEEELKVLKSLKLHTLYMGIESGDEATLELVCKGETAEQMVEAALRAQAAGLHMSIMVLLGLAGTARSAEHARNTALVLNRMQPRLLSFLRVVPVPGSGFEEQIASGEIAQLSERGVVEELREIIVGLELKKTVLRANHSSNVVPVEARMPRDKAMLIEQLGGLVSSGKLDGDSPGSMSMFL